MFEVYISKTYTTEINTGDLPKNNELNHSLSVSADTSYSFSTKLFFVEFQNSDQERTSSTQLFFLKINTRYIISDDLP